MAQTIPARVNRLASEVPNATSERAMKSADRREGKRFKTVEALLRDLGI